MNIREVNAWIIRELAASEGEREARSLARIVLEDGFDVKDLTSTEYLHPDTQLKLNDMVQRLKVGEPVQYLVGKAHFFGYDFKVTPDVLIPRPETEELVDLVLKREKKQKNLRILDVGTGSGCIPIVLKKKRPDWELWSIDVSPDALLLAEGNASTLEAEIEFRQLDVADESLWEQLPHFDVIVSNPPYIDQIERDDLEVRVSHFEPEIALFTPARKPFFYYKRLADLGLNRLKAGGRIYMEGSPNHLRKVVLLFEEHGYKDLKTLPDLQGSSRMVMGHL